MGALAQRLQMERGVAEYHLDQLKTRGLAVCTGGNYLHGYVYWGLTPEGRRYVVENGLISSQENNIYLTSSRVNFTKSRTLRFAEFLHDGARKKTLHE